MFISLYFPVNNSTVQEAEVVDEPVPSTSRVTATLTHPEPPGEGEQPNYLSSPVPLLHPTKCMVNAQGKQNIFWKLIHYYFVYGILVLNTVPFSQYIEFKDTHVMTIIIPYHIHIIIQIQWLEIFTFLFILSQSYRRRT